MAPHPFCCKIAAILWRNGTPEYNEGMGLLDQIGPVMVGPSSSHTAGACRLALLARHVHGHEPTKARFLLHGSFAKTAQGHGTDLALVAGVLGYQPDDPEIPNAFDRAKDHGLSYEFETADLGDVHPNTVRIELSTDDQNTSVLGSSVGGGFVEILEVNDFRAKFTGGAHTLLALHKDQPGVIAKVATVIADDNGNISTMFSAAQGRGGYAMMSIEMSKPLSKHVLDYFEHLDYIFWLRQLPNVMSQLEDIS